MNAEMARLFTLRDDLNLQEMVIFLGKRAPGYPAVLLLRSRSGCRSLFLRILWHGRTGSHGLWNTGGRFSGGWIGFSGSGWNNRLCSSRW